VTDALLPSALSPAPWAKSGLVAVGSSKPFIGAESLSSFCGWFNAPSTAAVVKSASNSGQLEGTIDLVAAFGSMPATVYVCAAAYATADGGVLAAQGPLGNGNGNLDPDEFLALSIGALRDENADGLYDRLDPALGFVVLQTTRAAGTTSLTWASVPGRSYQVETCDQLGGTWSPLGGPRRAGTGELTLSASDPTSLTTRFYRVRLVTL
jgi:hypothetical protein